MDTADLLSQLLATHDLLALLTRTSCLFREKPRAPEFGETLLFWKAGVPAEARLGSCSSPAARSTTPSLTNRKVSQLGTRQAMLGMVQSVFDHQLDGTIRTPSLRACQSMNILALHKLRDLVLGGVTGWKMLRVYGQRPSVQLDSIFMDWWTPELTRTPFCPALIPEVQISLFSKKTSHGTSAKNQPLGP